MERFNNDKGGFVRFPISDKTSVSEMTADFTLPDYQPEIKRLLRVSASVLPPSKYIGERGCSLAGNIDYFVLYTGSDNAVYCAPLTGEYKIDVPVEAEGVYLPEALGSVTVSPDMISGRVTAPRKISIKCRLRSRAQLFGDAALDMGGEHTSDDIQVLMNEERVSRVRFGVCDSVTVSDEMICDGRDRDIRVICADGKVLLSEAVAVEGAVLCRGDVYLKLLLCREDGSMPYNAFRKIPLSATVEVPGAENGDSASAVGTVTDMNITVEDCRIGITLGVMMEAEACGWENVSYVKDVYSTERKTENTYKNVTFPTSGAAFMGNFTLSDSLSLDEAGIAQGAHVLDVCGMAFPEEYTFEGGRCAVSGKTKFSMLLEKDGEYSSADIEVPFAYKTSASGDFDRAMCAIDVVSARARVDSERVGIDAEISVSGRAAAEKKETVLSDIGFGDTIERTRGEFVVCYPSDEDSLWSVAKRYSASLQSVAEANGIKVEGAADSRESIIGKNYLIV